MAQTLPTYMEEQQEELSPQALPTHKRTLWRMAPVLLTPAEQHVIRITEQKQCTTNNDAYIVSMVDQKQKQTFLYKLKYIQEA